jgi:transcriptional regulator with XRE-family HTH domain
MPRPKTPSQSKKSKQARRVLRSHLSLWRVHAGFATQDDLADKSGVSQESISKYESGDQPISNDALFKLADALGIAHDPLLIYYDPRKMPLDAAARTLPDADREDVEVLITLKQRRRQEEGGGPS